MRKNHKFIQKKFVSLLSLILIMPAYADVENSYIVTFKKPEKGIPPIITIPNKADKGISTAAFGENDSLQTRQDVANIISLKTGSRYFCESLFWASQPKQAAKT